jgi:hypothetical protein
VAGLIVGAVFLAAAEASDDRVYSKDELAKIVPAPVLTEIPPLATPTEQDAQARSKWRQRAVINAMALVVVAGFVATYLFG